MVNLDAGFYAVEAQAWRRLEGPWKQAGLSFTGMSTVAFLRALTQKQSLPKCIRIPGLDRALYQIYREHEVQGKREASRQVRQAVQDIGSMLYRFREHLLREGPVVLFVLEFLEHGVHWRAGVRHRGTGQPQELFRLEWLFPRCEVTQVDGAIVCFGRF